MGHFIQVLLADHAAVARAAEAVPHGVCAPLGAGLAVLPVTDQVWDEIQDHPPIESGLIRPDSAAEMVRACPALYGVLADLSQGGQAIYLETEYFGGSGNQWAILAVDGQIEAFWDDDDAINQALRRIGVSAAAGLDEFDTVGLGMYRSNSAFIGGVDPDAEPDF